MRDEFFDAEMEGTLYEEFRGVRTENAALKQERDKYHDALIARHGGEPIALLSELDEARAENAALKDLLREARDRISWDSWAPDLLSRIDAALAAKEGT